MVKLSIIAGPFRGEVRRFEGVVNLDRKVQTDPAGLLRDLVGHGSQWELDFSASTDEERFLWGRADLVARIMRAIMAGVPIRFLGIDFVGPGEIGNLEDAISNSGLDVFVEADDGTVLVIGHRGTMADN